MDGRLARIGATGTRFLAWAMSLYLALASPSCCEASALPTTAKSTFIDNLLARMSVTEKVGQLRMSFAGADLPPPTALQAVAEGRVGSMFTHPAATQAQLRSFQEYAVTHSRLGIPLFFAGDVVHGHHTIFPIGLGLASSWDLDAISVSARVAAREATGNGLDMTFAPMVDISRDPRWGRISEGFGEDPYLTSRIAATMVRGFQGQPGAVDSLMACVKHFAAYGAVEGGRDYNTTDLSAQRLYQDYLPPYQAAVDAGAGAMMTALTSLNGVPATANRWLLRTLLRQHWSFTGLVISDHGAVEELISHGVAGDGAQAAQRALDAGTEISMSDRYYLQALPTLTKHSPQARSQLDEAVRRVLSVKYDMGLFEDPFRRLQGAQPAPVQFSHPLYRSEARAIARRSLVLLKNDDATLPLKRQGTVALIGPLADNSRDILGSWPANGQPSQAVSLYQGLRTALGDRAQLLYALGANIHDNPTAFDLLADNQVVLDPRPPSALLAEALAIARQADVVIAALGEPRGMSHEGASKTTLDLPQQQRELLRALKMTGKPLVLVLMNGRPLSIVEESQWADAVLETWFSGSEGGNAIADVLLGDYNPSGKLPISFPRTVGQLPVHYNTLNTGRPFIKERPSKYKSRYFDLDPTSLYPFGYGLSYTSFSLSSLRLSTHQLPPGQSLQASITVKNQGSRSGETVVQLYLRDRVASVSRPIKELKGFRKVLLAPGESRRITFTVDHTALGFYNQDLQWITEPGEFEVMIGLDSQHLEHARFELLEASR